MQKKTDEVNYDYESKASGISQDKIYSQIENKSSKNLNNKNNDVAFSLFGVLSQLNYNEESLFIINDLLSKSPNTSKYIYSRAKIYLLQGNLSNSIFDFKNAIKLLFFDIKGQPEAFKFKKIKPHMVVEDAARALYDLKNLLDENNIPFFLVDGTLLGLHRDGELLPYDKDVDIGVPWDIPRLKIINLITYSNDFYIPEKELAASKFNWNFSVLHKTHGIAIDFFFFKKEGDFLECGLEQSPNPLVWRFSKFKTKLIKYRGNEYAIPENPEQYLTEIYGENWRVPDPHFDSIVSGYNLTPESKIIALSYAYAKLYNQLNKADWKKAFSYCHQIFAFEKELWLEELGSWLEIKIKQEAG
jgi:hypothetical protein